MKWFKRKESEMAKLKSAKWDLEYEVEKLGKEVRTAKDELADVMQESRLNEENIKHLVKMAKEAAAIELQKEKVKLAGEQQEAIATVKDDYRNKMEVQLKAEGTNIREMYDRILERLPNITAHIGDPVQKADK
jgi:hypothetical protein